MKVIVDSSVIIDYTRAKLGPLKDLFELRRKDKVDLILPSVVIAELWAGEEIASEAGRNKLDKLLSKFEKENFTEDIARITGDLIREKTILGFDAIIAATVLYLGAELATSNKKHFVKVKDLKFFSS